MTPYFKDNGMALDRMARDIQIMRDYFESLASSSMPALSRVIEQEFFLLVAILELLQIVGSGLCCGNDASCHTRNGRSLNFTGYVRIIHVMLKLPCACFSQQRKIFIMQRLNFEPFLHINHLCTSFLSFTCDSIFPSRDQSISFIKRQYHIKKIDNSTLQYF
jgi:hypothetical protein